jgi:hypothetical protein
MKRPPSAGTVALPCLLIALAALSFTSASGAATLDVVTVAATVPTAALDGSSTGLITFSRAGDTSADLLVAFALSGTAVKWVDYYRLPQGDMPVAVTIPAGSSSATLAITAKGNTTGANPETAVFTLSASPSYTVGAAATATIMIAPAASALPTIILAATVPTTAIGGAAPGLLTFSRTGATAGSLSIAFALSGTAVKWTDYYRLPQGDMPVAVTIPAGSSSTTLAITAKANITGANPETAVFTLSASPSYIVGATATATITIAAAAAALPTITLAATVPTTAIGGAAPGLLTFSRTGATAGSLSIAFALSGTAVKWTDYYRLPQGDMPVAVTIPAGSSSTTLAITAKANTTGAHPETAVFTLSASPSYTVGAAATAAITIVPSGSPVGTPPPAAPIVPAPNPPAGGGSELTGNEMDDTNLILPAVGDHALRVLTPTLLELREITTKAPDPAQAASWNFVNASGQSTAPSASQFTVTVGGTTVAATAVGFRRRVLCAPLKTYDLRIDNALYLQLASPVADGQRVVVTDPDGQIWPATESFAVTADPLRYSPGIHVNQEGYVPSFPKKAMIGYYLGDMGEMPVAATAFSVIDVATNAVVFQGPLTAREDVGYQTTPLPYQHVFVADFSGLTAPGEYQIQVEGMGTSLPFLINDGIAMAWVRTYALGMYEQRSGMAVGLPYTRFARSADHTAPASVPVPDNSPAFAFTWTCIKSYTSQATQDSPPMQFPQAAPNLTSNETSLYPFVNTGTVDVSGGHWDAGDYSKYTENSAQLIHELIFAVDNIPGVSTLDNLGIPESGDGIPDVLQEAKWEADFLVKMQDADGGFYFLVYPINEEYESSLPQNGEAQVVWPKNTSVSAAATAALAEAGSSPAMKRYYPTQAAAYLAAAQKGWAFLQAATARYGASRYQKLTFYSDDWQDNDEFAWAASALYAATGTAAYQTQLFALFPNPADPSTFRWGWWSMSEGWGNAIRDYAFAASSGRLPASDLNAPYLAACQAQIVAAGNNVVAWAADNAYGTPFAPATKAVLGGGWYFSLDQASDAAVAYLVSPEPAFVDALVSAMNYEGGTNPVNVTYLTGLGLKRQRNTVDQFAVNSRRILPPSGIPLGQVTAAFEYLPSYGSELSELSYPTDSGSTNTYPYYDRWSDAYNVTQEFITVNQARSLMATALLASLTSSSGGSWTAPVATITVPSATVPLNTPLALTVQVPGLDLTGSRIVWEGRDQQPAFGSTFVVTPVNNGDQWVEAEVEWPDGRRAFAQADFQANSPLQVWIDDALPAGATASSDGGDSWNWVPSNPAPKSGSLAARTILAAGLHEISFTGATAPMQVYAGDTLFAWVYLDSANPPSEILVAWNDGSSWEHRAYWGANTITYGANGTAGRHYAGVLPATGGWVKLSVPAAAVGLAGSAVSGMGFSLYNGRVTWDAIGRSSASP